MRIGIDARVLSSNTPTGIGTCVIQVLKYIAVNDCDNDYYLFSNESILDEYIFSERFIPIVIPSKSSSVWMIKELTKELPRYDIDVFWGTLHLLPWKNRQIRKVLTINDLALMVNPQWGNFKNSVLQNTLVRKAVFDADSIITISESTKRDLMRMLKVKNEKICIAYPGFEPAVISHESLDVRNEISELKSHNILLYIGTIEPRKNIINIVRAFNIIKRDHPSYKLVLAGKLGWNYNKILDEIQKSKYVADIYQIGYITGEEKVFLLRHAKAFLFPSYYEGFGIPVIEAIAYGLPVLTTRNSSLTEAAGPYEFYIDDPDDYQSIAVLVNQIIMMTLDELKQRNCESQDYIKRFSWKNFSKAVCDTLLHR